MENHGKTRKKTWKHVGTDVFLGENTGKNTQHLL